MTKIKICGKLASEFEYDDQFYSGAAEYFTRVTTPHDARRGLRGQYYNSMANMSELGYDAQMYSSAVEYVNRIAVSREAGKRVEGNVCERIQGIEASTIEIELRAIVEGSELKVWYIKSYTTTLERDRR